MAINISNPRTRTIIVAFFAFAGLGMSGGLLGLAWPFIQKQFNLSLDSVNVLFLVSTTAYSLSGFYIGRLMARFGSGTVLLAGMALLTICTFGIVASASWAFIIAFSGLTGLGSGIVDAGLNLYVATYHTPQQMSWLHAWFGIGVTIGPLIMTFVIAHLLGWQVGYAAVGTILFFIVLLFAVSRREWSNAGLQTAENKPVRRAPFSETMRSIVVWMGLATFFAYVGLEIGTGQWAFTLLTKSRGIPEADAGLWVSLYWGSFTGGRFLFGIIANRFKTEHILQVAMLGAIAGVVLLWWNPVPVMSLIGLLVTGVAQAPIFPLLMSDTARRVGAEHTENTISMQMGSVGIGAAILPGLIGTFGKNFGLETMAAAFVVMAVLVYGCHQLTNLSSTRQQQVLVQAEDRS